jgi:hypothetical protein
MQDKSNSRRLVDLPPTAQDYCQQTGLEASEAGRIAPLWDALTWDGQPLYSSESLAEQLEDRHGR